MTVTSVVNRTSSSRQPVAYLGSSKGGGQREANGEAKEGDQMGRPRGGGQKGRAKDEAKGEATGRP